MRGALSERRIKHAEFALHNIRCRHHAIALNGFVYTSIVPWNVLFQFPQFAE